jgi:hypothetical protein
VTGARADLPVCGITRFQERDLDLLLAEELRVTPGFGHFLMARFGLDGALEYPARMTTVSAVEDGTEIDVLARFDRRAGGVHVLMIEDKLDATERPDQLLRYQRRADNDLRLGRVAGASVLAVTPRAYRFAQMPEGARQIAIEDLAVWFRAEGGARAAYRASFLERCLPARGTQQRDARVMATEPHIRDWWDAVHTAVDAAFPGYFRHRTRYPVSVYFAPSTPGQADYLRVDFKGHRGEVDLAFRDLDPALLAATVAAIGDAPGRVVANGRSAALRIDGLEPFVIADGVAVIATRVLPAYRATHRLLEYWSRHRKRFDALYRDRGA